MGAQLFQRNTAKVELTAVGELYWQFFCQTQAEWEETQRKAEMILNAQGNLVHIGCNHDLNLGEWVLLIIEKCQSNGYSLGVDWERREPHDLLEPLLAGQLDVVFSFERALDDFKQADALEHVPIVQAWRAAEELPKQFSVKAAPSKPGLWRMRSVWRQRCLKPRC